MPFPNYRSLTNEYFAKPDNRALPVSIRSNNPGAINGAKWLRAMPGYVTEIKYDGKNPTTIFETPEQGVAVWYQLMKNYRAGGARTIKDIIWKYGGGQANYTAYSKIVSKWTGFPETKEIVLEDDKILLPFAKAMFKVEAGREIPWSDKQILYGFSLARGAPKGTENVTGALIIAGGATAALQYAEYAVWIILATIILTPTIWLGIRWYKNRKTNNV